MDDPTDLKTVPKEPYKCAIGKSFECSQFLHPSKSSDSKTQDSIDVHTMSGSHSRSTKQFQLIPYNTSSISIVKEVHRTSVSPDEPVLDQHKSCGIDLTNTDSTNKTPIKPLAKVSPLINEKQVCNQCIQTDALSIDLDSLMHLEDLSRSQRIYGLRSSNSSTDFLTDKNEALNQNHSGGKQQLTDLMSRNQELETLLKTQLKINSDLKKLLISSVGEDCTRTCENLSQENCELRGDLTESRLESLQLQEKYDQLCIEADMWKSKFIAGRVMVEELASWKSRLTNRYSESVTALQVISQEMRQMSDNIKYIHRLLLDYHNLSSTPPPPSPSPHSSSPSNMIELMNQCRYLLDKTMSESNLKEKSLQKRDETAYSVIPPSLPESKPPDVNKVVSTQRGSFAGQLVTMVWRQLCSGGISSVKNSGTTPEDRSIPLQVNCHNSTTTETNKSNKRPVHIVRETTAVHYEDCTLGEKLLQQVLYQHSLLSNDPTYHYHAGYNSLSSQTFERLSDSCKKCRGEITIL